MSLDPRFHIIEPEAEVSADPVVGDRVVVSSRGAPVDERLRNAEDLGDLLDVQIPDERELELFRLGRLNVSCHAPTSTNGEVDV